MREVARPASATPSGATRAAARPVAVLVDPAATTASSVVAAAEPQVAAKAAVAEAPSPTPAPPSSVRVAPQPARPAAPLDTAARLVGRPSPAPRTTPSRALAAIEPPAPTLTTAAALAASATTAEPAPPAPLDMTRHTWPTAMIARIATLRDAADAVSTTIRVVPDALGAIDVSLRQEGAVTHVHLVADQPQTRAMLAEAAPKLAELAEQRGLRLGDAQVQAGPGSQGRQQSGPQQSPHRPSAPPPQPGGARAEPSTIQDRIA